MLKTYTYNKTYREICRKTKYEQERELLHDFLASENENMCLEYENEREVKNAAQWIRQYSKEAKKGIVAKVRENFVIVEREGESV